VYLRKLGAVEPRAPSPPPMERVRVNPKGPPPRALQGEARRYRFVYEKLGAAAFLSHLDVIRALPRAFRRLELPLFYSQGFHPKPDMTFGPALSLGVASLCETVDMKIAADLEATALLDELSAGAQPGLRFVAGVALGGGDSAVSRVIDVARYAVGIPRTVVEARGGQAWLEERVGALRAATSLVVVRRIDGIGKRVDVRDFLRSIELATDEGSALLARAGIVGDLVPLTVEVDVRGSGGVKIAEVMEAMCGDPELPHRAVRVALGARLADGRIASTMELDTLRALRTARARSEAVVVAP
jgi:radical SAM-linked protein